MTEPWVDVGSLYAAMRVIYLLNGMFFIVVAYIK